MDADLKKKWVEALRSGNYEQTSNFLRRDNGYCCLGVLCEISGKASWEPGKHHGEWFYGDGPDRGWQYLPTPVKLVTGLTSEDADPLMDKNDSGETFAEIADYIEQNF